MINVHASLLPKYRGAAPVHRAVIDGEPETGVTIMRVVQDARRRRHVRARSTRPIGPDETSDVVERDLADLGARLLVEVVDRLAAGTAVEEPQDDALVDLRAEDHEGRRADRLDAAGRRHPQPRARPLPMAARLHAISTAPADRPAQSVAGQPATPRTPTRNGRRRRAATRSHVATGHGGRLAIDEVQPEGRSGRCACATFSPAIRCQPGARFTQLMTAPARIAAFHALRAIARGDRDLPSALRSTAAAASAGRARPRAGR